MSDGSIGICRIESVHKILTSETVYELNVTINEILKASKLSITNQDSMEIWLTLLSKKLMTKQSETFSLFPESIISSNYNALSRLDSTDLIGYLTN